MNEVLCQLHDRKSVRAYEDRPVEPEIKRAVLEAAIQAPTAGNMALYTILDITDPEKKAALAKSCDDQPFIAQAPMVLIFCAAAGTMCSAGMWRTSESRTWATCSLRRRTP